MFETKPVLKTVIINHLGAELLLCNDMFYCVLPQHLFPSKARGQRGGQTGWFTQLHRGDLRCLSKGHHGDNLA